MVVLSRARTGTEETPGEEVEIAGTTGNIYVVNIGRRPTCTCPDHQKGNECKHKIYILHFVLKAPEHLVYQLAFLSSELREILDRAPPIPSEVPTDDNHEKRKTIEGECPICYMELDEKQDKLVWCKAACGNNMHKSCFDAWAASQNKSGNEARCVYCRSIWQRETSENDSIKRAGELTSEGYVNVAEQLGMSRARDYSTYYQPWARNRFGLGW